MLPKGISFVIGYHAEIDTIERLSHQEKGPLRGAPSKKAKQVKEIKTYKLALIK